MVIDDGCLDSDWWSAMLVASIARSVCLDTIVAMVDPEIVVRRLKNVGREEEMVLGC